MGFNSGFKGLNFNLFAVSQDSPASPSSESTIKIKMTMVHGWKDADRKRLTNLYHYHFIHNKSHVDSPGFEKGLPRREAGD